MLPKEFLDRVKNQNYIDFKGLTEALESPSPVSIRVNTFKWNKKPGLSPPVPWCRDGYYLKTRPSFTADPLFHSGCYYPQEASSMFLEQAFNQLVTRNGYIRVLDLCGAPGGKSTHLSSLIGDNGLLVANESIGKRAGVLAENITKWGIGNAIVTNNDPAAFSSLKNYFDLILIDAPCSGEGMFSDQVARSEWSPGNAALCTERQRRIVTDAWPSLKENGLLIYSTCTFNPAENEENIKWLSEKTGASSVKLDISKYSGVNELIFKGITGYSFYPGKIKGEGLFISVVRKTDSLPGNFNRFLKKSDNQLTANDKKIAGNLINTSLNKLYRHNDIVYDLSLPDEEYQTLKNYLRIIKGGAALFKIRNDDFTPLHDLALSCKIKKGAFPSAETDYKQSISFLKKENLILQDTEKGWILLNFRSVNLGFAKNIGSRINNYFPVERRIRMSDSSLSAAIVVKWQ